MKSNMEHRAEHDNAPATEVTRIGVVIVHYHRGIELHSLVGQFVNELLFNGNDIVVCDNGSAVGDMDRLRSSYPQVRVVKFENIGYGAAVNRGFELLDSECKQIFVATHELVMERDCLTKLSSALNLNPGVGVCGPLLRNAGEGDRVWSAGGVLSHSRQMPAHKATFRQGELVDCEWLDGSALLFERGSFLSVGGFAEAFFLYFEDVEIGCALRAVNKRVCCVTDAVAYQSPGGHLNHLFAVRNFAWMLRVHGFRVAYLSWIVENVLRVVVGTVLKPKGAGARQSQRVSALLQALRLPTGLATRRATLYGSKRSQGVFDE